MNIQNKMLKQKTKTANLRNEQIKEEGLFFATHLKVPESSVLISHAVTPAVSIPFLNSLITRPCLVREPPPSASSWPPLAK